MEAEMKKTRKTAPRTARQRRTTERTNPLEQAAAAGRAIAYELPPELLADFLEQGALPKSGNSFDFGAAVEARADDGVEDEDRQVAREVATADIAFQMGVSCGLALAGIVTENAGISPLLVAAFRQTRQALRGAR